jgi:hypothetical protein
MFAYRSVAEIFKCDEPKIHKNKQTVDNDNSAKGDRIEVMS